MPALPARAASEERPSAARTGQALRDVFGHTRLRTGQTDLIQQVMKGFSALEGM